MKMASMSRRTKSYSSSVYLSCLARSYFLVQSVESIFKIKIGFRSVVPFIGLIGSYNSNPIIASRPPAP